MSEHAYTKNPCNRCSHSPDDHRLDDFAEITDPTDPAAKFRCVIGLLRTDLAPKCGCPDFVGEPLSWVGGEKK